MEKRAKQSLHAVAISFIILGAVIFVFGLLCWYISMVSGVMFISYPFFKVIGGLIIMALGYIQLELTFIRTK